MPQPKLIIDAAPRILPAPWRRLTLQFVRHPMKAPNSGYDLGVTFTDPDDVFRVRMVEQIFRIQDYRPSVSRLEARKLSVEQAANEWISTPARQ